MKRKSIIVLLIILAVLASAIVYGTALLEDRNIGIYLTNATNSEIRVKRVGIGDHAIQLDRVLPPNSHKLHFDPGIVIGLRDSRLSFELLVETKTGKKYVCQIEEKRILFPCFVPAVITENGLRCLCDSGDGF